MKFARWLRSNSEHYLLMAAQRDVAARYGRPCARPKEGVKAWFFLTVFAPIYRLLPWRLRSFVLHSMPGSHRQAWTPRPRRPLGPAV
jgi:hypothetical protein